MYYNKVEIYNLVMWIQLTLLYVDVPHEQLA